MYFKNLTTPFRDDCTEFISSVSYIFMIIYNYKLVSFFVQLSIFKAQDGIKPWNRHISRVLWCLSGVIF